MRRVEKRETRGGGGGGGEGRETLRGVIEGDRGRGGGGGRREGGMIEGWGREREEEVSDELAWGKSMIAFKEIKLGCLGV